MAGFTADGTLKSLPMQVDDVMLTDEEVDTDNVAPSSMVRGIDRRILTLIDIAVKALELDELWVVSRISRYCRSRLTCPRQGRWPKCAPP